jgi:hypothetical protein
MVSAPVWKFAIVVLFLSPLSTAIEHSVTSVSPLLQVRLGTAQELASPQILPLLVTESRLSRTHTTKTA